MGVVSWAASAWGASALGVTALGLTAAGTSASAAPAAVPPAGGARPNWPTAFHAWPGPFTRDWTSSWHSPRDGFTTAIASWQVDTPPGSWVRIELQVRTATTTSRWYVVGDWARDDSTIKRHSATQQSDAVGAVNTDTFKAAKQPPGGRPTAYRLRVTSHGTATARPTVRQAAVASSVPGKVPTTPSAPLSRRGVELPVPRYSQSTHRGEYPAFGGGGEVWCSPTSTAMVLSYWRTGPTQADIDSLPPDPKFDANGRKDGQVNWAVFGTWDSVYDGAGNWPFNTAYAAAYGLDASVRQHSTLAEWERWIRRGVPVVASMRWDNTSSDPLDHLDGSAITKTDGHLLVPIGFTAAGDVIVNDPAAPTNDDVRRVYKRRQFEYRWLDSTAGTGYLIKRRGIIG